MSLDDKSTVLGIRNPGSPMSLWATQVRLSGLLSIKENIKLGQRGWVGLGGLREEMTMDMIKLY